MKRKHVIGLALLFVLAGTLLWFLINSEPRSSSPSFPAVEGNTNAGEKEKPPSKQTQSKEALAPINQQGAPLPPAVDELRSEAEARWKQRIDFYGKVVDQDGVPVPGALVEFVWTTLEGTPTAQTVTDSEGLFEITGLVGKRLGVHVSKEGYYTSRRERGSFDYGSPSLEMFHSPDPQNPVVFQLTKRGEGAYLITSEQGTSRRFNVAPAVDGSPVWVDFLNRSSGSSGQLKLSQTKPNYENWRDANEWTVRMEIPDGGFVEHDEEFPLEAPERGYQPVVEINFRKGDPDWSIHLRRNYYIKFGNPARYGRLDIDTSIHRNTITLNYAVNPSGSRNLETVAPQTSR